MAAAVLRESLMQGGRACRPLVAAHGLSTAFIDPAVAHLAKAGAAIRFNRRLRAIELGVGPRRGARFRRRQDRAWARRRRRAGRAGAGCLLPVAGDHAPPSEFRAIVNAHYKIAPPPGQPPILAVINGTVEWLFAFDGRLSVTISGADRLIDTDREVLARDLWARGRQAHRPAAGPSAWQIVKERRATHAALPAEEAKRPPAATRWAESGAGRRLDPHRPARHHRRRDPLRQQGGGTVAPGWFLRLCPVCDEQD